jgi:hypothetical protein
MAETVWKCSIRHLTLVVMIGGCFSYYVAYHSWSWDRALPWAATPSPAPKGNYSVHYLFHLINMSTRAMHQSSGIISHPKLVILGTRTNWEPETSTKRFGSIEIYSGIPLDPTFQ